MKNINIFLFTIILFLASCNNDTEIQAETTSLTFEDIQQKYNFPKPYTEASKEYILQQFETVENYHSFLKERMIEKQNKTIVSPHNKSSLQDRDLAYNIYLLNRQTGIETKIRQFIWETTSILDTAEEYGLQLPYNERAGSSTTCIAFLTDGGVNHETTTILSQSDIEKGWRLPCVAYAVTDCRLITHAEDAFYDSSCGLTWHGECR
ncbi:2Fe-2S iron-sulfur cluster-binding protein [Ascidiimonas aurantiaca]|uniref:2Fe-2S iron-sulfur cluster-binding protein n=1 Tax=Ascidiimonas aurantiaca TaxID=1685432 RepID=UPI0030ED981C